MISAASTGAANALSSAPSGYDYFSTEAHYLALADRIVAALRDDATLVLVTGDTPADPHRISGALRKAGEGRYTVVGISSGSDFTTEELLRAGSLVAALPVGGGMWSVPEAPEPASPLLVFEDLDRLPDSQLEKICEATQRGLQRGMAGVLLASTGFLARLQDPSRQFLEKRIAAQFRFDEIGQDEAIEFLRHQLATRHLRNEARGVRTGMLRGLAALGLLVTAAIGGFIALYYLDIFGQPIAHSTIADPPTQTASISLSTAPREPDPAPEKAKAPAAPAQGPEGSPATQQANIAALVTRGDDFLKAGDISSARLFYERAAEMGDGAAALRLGATFDPGFLDRSGVIGMASDPARASSWYRRARDLGEAAAMERLRRLDQQPRAAPGSPAH